MKAIVCLAVLAVCVALVVGESCNADSDCAPHEKCDPGYSDDCHKTFGSREGTCTCTKFQTCTTGTASGCTGSCSIGHHWSCVDNVCKCFWGHGGK